MKIELQAFGAVLIFGPKWCGKTTTASKHSNSKINLQDPINKNNYLNILSVNPSLLLDGNSPMLIDEWQEAPQIWDYIRQEIDQRLGKGLYILTGSSQVDKTKISHSGAGRISRLLMRTLSLYESEHSSGEVSLKQIFDNVEFPVIHSKLTIEDYAELIVRGGFPDTIDSPLEVAIRQIDGYLNIISEQEISSISKGYKNSRVINKIIRSLARNSATQATISTLIKDLKFEDVEINRETLSNYINILKELFILEDLDSWNPKLRSKATTRTKRTRHFIDPSLAARALNANVNDLLSDFETFGLLFETLVIRDLRIYSERLNGHVSHYRDSYNYEADAVIHLDDGRWGLVEVKLGSLQIDKAAENLIYLKNNIMLKKEPSFLMIITGGNLAYQRPDGVYVVPIGCLKP